jgi:hypothetical protein
MAAPTSFPSWAYNSAGQPALIVPSLTAFNALLGPGTWSSTPFSTATPVPPAPYDTYVLGTGTDQVLAIRMQQLLVEARAQSEMMAQAFLLNDDPVTIMRPDILANDASLTS